MSILLVRPLGEVSGRHERPGEHPVDVEHAVEVVDLVLQDPGVPATAQLLVVAPVGIDPARSYRRRPLHQGAVPGRTLVQPSNKVRRSSPTASTLGIGSARRARSGKRSTSARRSSGTRAMKAGDPGSPPPGAGNADLRGRQPDTRSLDQPRPHGVDELGQLGRADRRQVDGMGSPAQDWSPGLHDSHDRTRPFGRLSWGCRRPRCRRRRCRRPRCRRRRSRRLRCPRLRCPRPRCRRPRCRRQRCHRSRCRRSRCRRLRCPRLRCPRPRCRRSRRRPGRPARRLPPRAVVPGVGSGRLAPFGRQAQQLAGLGVLDPPERPAVLRSGQHRHLQVRHGHRLVGSTQGGGGRLQGVAQRPAGPEELGHVARDASLRRRAPRTGPRPRPTRRTGCGRSGPPPPRRPPRPRGSPLPAASSHG